MTDDIEVDDPGGSDEGEGHRGFARLLQVLLVATRLGLTSFGGPVAHLGYFREEYVRRRRWLTDEEYVDLVALCQFLPGPASSQVGMGVGLKRAGLPGAFAAWIGFTAPSAIALILFAYGVSAAAEVLDAGGLAGLKIAAVAVVAWAVWGMARTLCPDRPRITLAVLAACAMLAMSGTLAQIGVIVAGGVIGWRLLRVPEPVEKPQVSADGTPASGFAGIGSDGIASGSSGKRVAVAALAVFVVLLVGLPALRQSLDNDALDVADGFYRAGSLVFGGGHVVLPLLQAEVVPPGWVDEATFTAGYGAAQAVPGPLFTFAGYLGASIASMPAPWVGGSLALGAVFLPSYLLVVATLPFWDMVRRHAGFRRALMGINAAVVGLLLAALYDPVWTSAIHSPRDFALAVAAFGLLVFWKLPPWLVVVAAAVAGWGLSAVPDI
jgi:chromate transporter